MSKFPMKSQQDNDVFSNMRQLGKIEPKKDIKREEEPSPLETKSEADDWLLDTPTGSPDWITPEYYEMSLFDED